MIIVITGANFKPCEALWAKVIMLSTDTCEPTHKNCRLQSVGQEKFKTLDQIPNLLIDVVI